MQSGRRIAVSSLSKVAKDSGRVCHGWPRTTQKCSADCWIRRRACETRYRVLGVPDEMTRPPGTNPIVSYPWYVPDWRNSETRLKLSLAERGFFRELLDHCYVEGSIPDDVDLLARIAGCSVAEARRHFIKVREEFELDGNRLVNPRATEILE